MRNDNNNDIAARLKAIREALGFTQTEFAQKIGSSGPSISELEKGKYKPNLDMIIRMATDFKVNLYYIIFGQGKMFSELRDVPYHDFPVRIVRDAYANQDDILHFLIHMEKSRYVQYSALSHFQMLLATEGGTIQKELEAYDKKKEREE
ncbi:MAG: helix-turn-helix transcriptional regulator [bacterium]|nr:helix-turn-helix transcriptional regulator [bacterium]